MSIAKHRIVLRQRPLNSEFGDEKIIELKTTEELFETLNTPTVGFLYLGMYNLGELVAWSGDKLGFEGLLNGNSSSLHSEFAPLYFSKQCLEKVINRELTLEELLSVVWSEYENIEFELVDNPDRAWELIQNYWLPRLKIKDIIDTRLADEETIFKEQRILFLK